MIDLQHFASAINQIEEEKGISRDKILETVEMAIAAAYKKDYGEKGQIIRAKLDPDTGKFDLWQEKIVVDESMIKTEEEIEKEQELSPEEREKIREEEESGEREKKVRFNEEKHIMLEDAKKIDKDAEVGEPVRFEVEVHEDFGRIAAQTAKQVIIQRMREAERDAIYEEYEEKIDNIISGIVQRIEGNTIFFDLGRTTGVMLAKDRIPGERYRTGQRMRLYLLSIEHTPKGPQIFVSRAHPKMLSRLFELEVPEIASGTVEVKAVARETGSRSKIAVTSEEEEIDPIGACVGQRGTRVSAVIQELGGEKIDIIEWSEDIETFVASALSPAKVLEAEQADGRIKVTVSEDQLSLAIGKDGQNVRLAAKLTGWKIDVISKETGEVEQTFEESHAMQEEGSELPKEEDVGDSVETPEEELPEGEDSKEGEKGEEKKEEEEGAEEEVKEEQEGDTSESEETKTEETEEDK